LADEESMGLVGTRDPLQSFLSGKRGAPRHAVDLPVRLGGREGAIDAAALDVSRGGALLRVSADALGGGGTGLDALAAVERHLGGGFDVVFPAGRLALEAEVVRIAVRPGEPENLYIGSRWLHPPSADQLEAVGVFEGGEPAAVPLDTLPMKARADRPTAALIYDDATDVLGPRFIGQVVAMGRNALAVHVPGASSADVSRRLDGRELQLRVLRGGRLLWESAANLLAARYADHGGGGVELGLLAHDKPPRRVRSGFATRP
jgi:hypothetical protein